MSGVWSRNAKQAHRVNARACLSVLEHPWAEPQPARFKHQSWRSVPNKPYSTCFSLFAGRVLKSEDRWPSPPWRASPSRGAVSTLVVAIDSTLVTMRRAHGGCWLRYLPPFETLRSEVKITTVKGELMVSCSYELFVQLIRRMIADVPVAEEWYLESYPDIADAVHQGVVATAKAHFVHDGYFEGRLPFPIIIDEKYYLTNNPDVTDQVRKGDVVSGQQHFNENGYREGRLPFGL
jgi:hypothetical protein